MQGKLVQHKGFYVTKSLESFSAEVLLSFFENRKFGTYKLFTYF